MFRRGLNADDAYVAGGVLNNGGSDVGQLNVRSSKGALPVNTGVASNDNMNPTTHVRLAMNGANAEVEFEYNSSSFGTPDQTTAFAGTVLYVGFYIVSGDGSVQNADINYWFE